MAPKDNNTSRAITAFWKRLKDSNMYGKKKPALIIINPEVAQTNGLPISFAFRNEAVPTKKAKDDAKAILTDIRAIITSIFCPCAENKSYQDIAIKAANSIIKVALAITKFNVFALFLNCMNIMQTLPRIKTTATTWNHIDKWPNDAQNSPKVKRIHGFHIVLEQCFISTTKSSPINTKHGI